MELTRDNYYSPEADREYMSCSQYQDFLECEAATMAKMHGLFVPKETEALLVGNYVHTALESDEAHEEFIEAHMDSIFKLKTSKATGETSITGKYAAFQKADEIIQIFLTDPTLKQFILMDGENEKIMTGNLFGMKWKIRLDKYTPDRMIIDYKTAADLSTEYNLALGERECFLEAYGYLMRAAVYSEIEKQFTGNKEDPPFIILAVTKQEPCDKGAYLLNHRQRYDWELSVIEAHMKRIREVKWGMVRPRRCGHCEWCRKTKRLTGVIPYYHIKPGYQAECEEEYDGIFASYMEAAQAQRGL
ncbi:MAG: PD-(D/E)XK nuclease-like domain-containing protein [Clostridia bacterium]|nr:PD-(D/E)XK nuclease-like domain-containing protein [Clostridia bacterium]